MAEIGVEATREELAASRPRDAIEPAGVQRGARFGDYVVLEPIGRGAMGQVFRALHPQLDRCVALKLIALPPHDEARAVAEPPRHARRAGDAGHLPA